MSRNRNAWWWWYRPSLLTCFLLGALLVFAFRAFAQASGAPDPVDVSTPPETILPLLPAVWQRFWVYYFVPIFIGVHSLMLALSHLPAAKDPKSPVGKTVTWWFSGAHALARLTGAKLPDDDEKNVALPLQQATPSAGSGSTPPKTPSSTPMIAFACFALLFLGSACSTFGSASGSTGKVDLGKDVSCTLTLGATDPTSCTKPVTNVCTVPDLKDSAGNCTSVGIDTGSLNLGKGYSCRATVAPAAQACFATVTTSCVVPVTRAADGSCPQ